MTKPVHRAPRHRGAPANPLVDVPHKAARTTAKTTLLLSVLALGGTGAAVAGGVAYTGPATDDPTLSAGESAAADIPELTDAQRAAIEAESAARGNETSLSRSAGDRREVADPGKQAALSAGNDVRAIAGVEEIEIDLRNPKDIAKSMLGDFGWGLDQFSCLEPLWEKESGWNVSAANPSSSAYGIPQALPGSKMASAGDDWETNPATQIEWGLGYINDRYGSPCGAWSHSQSAGWY
ncbi:lytic transglycosylase domain-containing protein [Nocardioides sp. NBC_00850]|uniref:aggregation-promoting factor C-terminal-like domain-containing protein n=1 Tax=Nocardioides sp. NBC_00850 TaxID=2976001 RepID=UPI0038663921|nr:lytic transglycosylase domain-containing protein [Nocardioides sp. NBC_00850]